MTQLWFTEKQTADLKLSLRVKETIYREKSPFQQIDVVDTYQFGRVLLLDGIVQTTTVDEFVYHEMISHVALNSHANPQSVAVVGGGDGGTVREVLKHESVQQVRLIEIDGAVVEASKRFLPEISCGLDDPRAKVRIEDGIKHMAQAKEEYDVVIVDSTDPVGAAVGLFSQEFYRSVHNALKSDGILVTLAESPWTEPEAIRRVQGALRGVFPIVKLYLCNVPTYPNGLWSFSIASKVYDPTRPIRQELPFATRYYTPAIHEAAFTLPPFVQEIIAGIGK
ncbi:MAG: polyamine aminopropyltransferase [Limnochordia bacterium]|nr:polyamine aminopropyltransferase [Limnochordia bacterium]MDD2630170.1 polyamine aminopropyltransferase [Limnochordia bacterium]MDD4518266.1 polyamine aminopropyltransferase [Limnochordia bacterium]